MYRPKNEASLLRMRPHESKTRPCGMFCRCTGVSPFRMWKGKGLHVGKPDLALATVALVGHHCLPLAWTVCLQGPMSVWVDAAFVKAGRYRKIRPLVPRVGPFDQNFRLVE